MRDNRAFPGAADMTARERQWFELGRETATEDYQLIATGEAARGFEPARGCQPLRSRPPAGSLQLQLISQPQSLYEVSRSLFQAARALRHERDMPNFSPFRRRFPVKVQMRTLDP